MNVDFRNYCFRTDFSLYIFFKLSMYAHGHELMVQLFNHKYRYSRKGGIVINILYFYFNSLALLKRVIINIYIYIYIYTRNSVEKETKISAQDFLVLKDFARVFVGVSRSSG